MINNLRKFQGAMKFLKISILKTYKTFFSKHIQQSFGRLEELKREFSALSFGHLTLEAKILLHMTKATVCKTIDD